jgi:hypothetical protein
MPIKSALAIALAAILSPLVASTALAAPPESASASVTSGAPATPKPKVTKVRPSRRHMGTAPPGRRKHDARPSAKADTKPESHGPAIAMTKPLALSRPLAAPRAPAKPIAKRSDAKKGEGKKSDARAQRDGVPVVAAAIPELPDLPPSAERKPLTLGGRVDPKRKAPCLQAPIDVLRGTEQERLSLAKCDGTVLDSAVDKMSVLLRPGGASRERPGTRVDARVLERLGAITTHFAASKIQVVSGYRPSSAGSYHASGRAMDFRIDGVKNEDVVAFCKTLDDTGCGYYPNSSFVHVDVRDPGAGHVTWIDASGPGEAPQYVASWPPPADADVHKDKDARQMIEDLLATLEKELPPVPKDEHPVVISTPPARQPAEVLDIRK